MYDPIEAIRTECTALRESTLLHPADPMAADAIEAHLDELLKRVHSWRTSVVS